MGTLRTFASLMLALNWVFISTGAQAQDDYYWVGDGGNWSDFANHWATTSGGSTMHTEVPGSDDNTIFDGNSFTVSGETVALDVIAECNNMDWTGVTNNPSFVANGNELNIFGSLTFNALMTISLNVVEFESTTAGNTVTTKGLDLGSSSIFRFRGDGGEWTIQDATNLRSLQLKAGTLNLGSNNINASSSVEVSNQASELKVLNLESSTITTERFWVTGTNITMNSGTSTIIVSSFKGDTQQDGPFTYHDVQFDNYGVLESTSIFDNLTIPPGLELSVEAGKTFTFNALSANGTKHQPIIINSSSAGSPGIFSQSTGSVDATFVEVRDITATGGATFNAINSIDVSGNSGWNFTTYASQDYYWVENGGNWNDTDHWATSTGGTSKHSDYPGKFDNVFFDANSFMDVDQLVEVNVDAACNDMNWTGTTNAPTLSGAFSFQLDVYGSVTFTDQVNKDIWNVNLVGTGSNNLTYANSGRILNLSISGNYTLLDAIDVQGLILNGGTFNSNNMMMSATSTMSFVGSEDGTVINLTASTINSPSLTLNNFNYQPTINAGTSTINLTGNLNVQSNTVSGFTFHNLIIDGTSTIEGSNTYNSIEIMPGSIVSFEESEVHTINSSFSITGVKANPIVLNSSQSGSQATISVSSGTVDGIYLVLQDLIATGGATFNATETDDQGNNVGWNISGLTPADYYWVGGDGDWSEYATHWATTSGGNTFHSGGPSTVDNVYFDANSFSGDATVTISSADANCHDLDASGVSENLVINGVARTINIYGSVDIPDNVQIDMDEFNFFSDPMSTETLDFSNGPGTQEVFNFLGSGTWKLHDHLNIRELNFHGGTFDTSDGSTDYDVSASFQFDLFGSDTKTININSSSIFARSLSFGGSNYTLTANPDSEITVSSTFSPNAGSMGSITLGNVVVTQANEFDECTIIGDLSINTLTFEPGVIVKINQGDVITVNELNAIGTSDDPINFKSDSPGFSATISKSSGNVQADYLILQDITATGGAKFLALNSVAVSNVIGWEFSRESQTITPFEIADKSFDEDPFTISTTSSSGLPVSFNVLTGPVELQGSTVTITGVGDVVIQAVQEGDIDFDPATPLEIGFTISPADQIIQFSDITKTFGDEAFELNATGGNSGNPIVYTSSNLAIANIEDNMVSILGAGSTTLTASQAGSTNYSPGEKSVTLTVEKADQQITFDEIQDVMEGQIVELIASINSGLIINFEVTGPASLSGDQLTTNGVGTVSVTASQSGSANFNPAPSVTRTFQVTSTAVVSGIGPLPLELSLYPNPAIDLIRVEGVKLEKAIIYNMNGSIEMKAQPVGNALNLKDLTYGVYLIRINDRSELQRIIIQR